MDMGLERLKSIPIVALLASLNPYCNGYGLEHLAVFEQPYHAMQVS